VDAVKAPRPVVRVDRDVAPLVPAFLASRRDLARESAEAIGSGRFGDVRRIAHRIAGAARLYGFAALAGIADALENAAAAGDGDTMAARQADLEAYLDRVEVDYSSMEAR
jgi:HPt (histidine-containing phosphotransfer) domain-containing protein